MMAREKSCLVLLGLIGSAAVVTPAWACDPQVSRVSAPRNAPYEPFAPDVAVYSLDIDIRNRDDDRCELQLVALSTSPGQRNLIGSAGGGRLAYDLTIGTGLRIPNEEAATFGAPIVLTPKAEQTVRLQLRINPGQVVPSGHYDEQLRLRIISKSGGVRTNERQVPVSVQVQSRAQVNIAGTAGNFSAGVRSARLDLGSLERGATGRMFIQVRANEPVTLRLESLNRGRLTHVQAADQSIHYEFSVDGQRINLAAPTILSRRPPRTLDGAAYEARTTVAPVEGRLAGEYRDVVTVSVDATG